MNTIIIALKYNEPEWMETWNCIVKCNAPVILADRLGVGNMAKAYNDAFNNNWEIIKRYDYVWMVSNIVFDKSVLKSLEFAMRESGFSAIHPSFKSDHKHLRPQRENKIIEVPFIEFTAPIIKTDTFFNYRLDERMPYVGHDLDWGYRVTSEGGKIGVYHGVDISHTYIRNNKKNHIVTEMRKQLRELWVGPTNEVLTEKYGKEWKSVLKYNNGL